MSELIRFANKLKYKLAQAKKLDTTALFFGDFTTSDAENIQTRTAYIKSLEANKKLKDLMGSNGAYSLYAYAKGTDAYWTVDCNPKEMKYKVYSILNEEYTKLTNMSMLKREQDVKNILKSQPNGSGNLRIIDLFQDINQI